MGCCITVRELKTRMLRFSQLINGALFGRYLWVTNTATSGFFLAIGDGLEQKFEQIRALPDKRKAHDWHRTGRMMIVGFGTGLPQHWWYSWLDRVLPGISIQNVAKKVLLDQVICAPLICFAFFMGSSLLEQHSLQQSWNEFQAKFLIVYKTDCAVWPPLMLINFLYVPPPYRVLYVNSATVAWNIFLSNVKHVVSWQ